MIRVNLLPQELRRRSGSSVSPVFAGSAVSVILLLMMGALWYWVQDRIAISEQRLADLNTELAIEQKKASEVRAFDKQITAIEQQVNKIKSLIDRKVYQTEMLDDFANLFGVDGNFSQSELQASVKSFTLKPISSSPNRRRNNNRQQPDAIAYLFTVQFHLYGNDYNKAGDYLKSFFDGVDGSPFWAKNNFQNKAEDSYRGDNPIWHQDLGLVEIALNPTLPEFITK